MTTTRMIRAVGIALLFAMSACRGDSASNDATNRAKVGAPGSGKVNLLIRTASGQRHHFTVELAIDDLSQQHGLMGRTSLPDNHGMLFPFPVPTTASFWMKDTSLPLDLLFIRPDGTVAAILQGKPNDLHPISAGEAVSAVLEIRQGRAQALGLSPGDRVRWGDCDSRQPEQQVVWQADRFCPAGPN